MFFSSDLADPALHITDFTDISIDNTCCGLLYKQVSNPLEQCLENLAIAPQIASGIYNFSFFYSLYLIHFYKFYNIH